MLDSILLKKVMARKKLSAQELAQRAQVEPTALLKALSPAESQGTLSSMGLSLKALMRLSQSLGVPLNKLFPLPPTDLGIKTVFVGHSGLPKRYVRNTAQDLCALRSLSSYLPAVTAQLCIEPFPQARPGAVRIRAKAAAHQCLQALKQDGVASLGAVQLLGLLAKAGAVVHPYLPHHVKEHTDTGWTLVSHVKDSDRCVVHWHISMAGDASAKALAQALGAVLALPHADTTLAALFARTFARELLEAGPVSNLDPAVDRVRTGLFSPIPEKELLAAAGPAVAGTSEAMANRLEIARHTKALLARMQEAGLAELAQAAARYTQEAGCKDHRFVGTVLGVPLLLAVGFNDCAIPVQGV